MKPTFVIGDQSEGYDIVKRDRKLEPWESRVWLDRRIVRTDRHDTRDWAVRYCHSRYKFNRGKGLSIHIRPQ
jgi:hypothetical protein